MLKENSTLRRSNGKISALREIIVLSVSKQQPWPEKRKMQVSRHNTSASARACTRTHMCLNPLLICRRATREETAKLRFTPTSKINGNK